MRKLLYKRYSLFSGIQTHAYYMNMIHGFLFFERKSEIFCKNYTQLHFSKMTCETRRLDEIN